MRELDVITEFDGRAIRNLHELILRVVEMEPGRKVKLKFVREGKAHEATATLKERPRPSAVRAPVPSPMKPPKPK
jgi:S1-C subfamily serine protease